MRIYRKLSFGARAIHNVMKCVGLFIGAEGLDQVGIGCDIFEAVERGCSMFVCPELEEVKRARISVRSKRRDQTP